MITQQVRIADNPIKEKYMKNKDLGKNHLQILYIQKPKNLWKKLIDLKEYQGCWLQNL